MKRLEQGRQQEREGRGFSFKSYKVLSATARRDQRFLDSGLWTPGGVLLKLLMHTLRACMNQGARNFDWKKTHLETRLAPKHGASRIQTDILHKS